MQPPVFITVWLDILKKIRKAEVPCPGKNAVQFFLEATGIRRSGEKVGLYLLDGSSYDPEPLGAVARQ
jgi:hypothetical protein